MGECGLCSSIHAWVDAARRMAFSGAYEPFPPPPDAEQLGRETWTFLHTLAAYYPERPTIEYEKKTSQFFALLSELYPCGVCAEGLRDELKINPPRTESAISLSNWLCQVHNEVNARLGKPVFDCSRVFERWKQNKDGK